MDFHIDKVIFQGTPAQFYAVAASYETQCDIEGRATAVLTFGMEAPANDALLVYVNFYPGSIEARCLPRNRTLLIVRIPTENQTLHEDWERLHGMLISEGWVEADSLPNAAIKGQESYRHAFPEAKRQAIAKHFRDDEARGRIGNKENWAKTKYSISAKTLNKYLKEFPKPEV